MTASERPQVQTTNASGESGASERPRVVTLTHTEMMTGSYVGAARQTQALDEGLRSRGFMTADKQWGIHIIGALGEKAAAKALGVYFSETVGTFHNGVPDLKGLEVRTRSKHDYDLLVRPDDDDDIPYVLVTGTGPEFHVWGWMTGAEAKQDRWSKTHGNRPPAFFVPKEHLHDLEDLP